MIYLFISMSLEKTVRKTLVPVFGVTKVMKIVEVNEPFLGYIPSPGNLVGQGSLHLLLGCQS